MKRWHFALILILLFCCLPNNSSYFVWPPTADDIQNKTIIKRKKKCGDCWPWNSHMTNNAFNSLHHTERENNKKRYKNMKIVIEKSAYINQLFYFRLNVIDVVKNRFRILRMFLFFIFFFCKYTDQLTESYLKACN